MPDKVLGLDIQKETVNAVLIKASFRNPQIVSFTSIPFQDSDDEEQDDWDLTIDELNKKVNITGSIPIVAFPASEVSFRNMRIPFKDPKKIRQILPFELEPLMIRPLDEGIIDFQIIEKGEFSSLIACMADMLTMHALWGRIQKLDIEPEFVPIESISTVLCLFEDQQVPDDFIFVDFQWTQSIVVFVANRTIAFIRRIEYPESSNAEKILARSIFQTQIYYSENISPEYLPEHLMITGARFDNSVRENLEEQLEMDIQDVNLVHRLSIKMDKSISESWNANVMDNALALAMIQNRGNISFNLRQGPYAIKRRWQEYKNEIVNTFLWLIILTLGFCSNMFIDNKIIEKQDQQLTKEVKRIFEQALPGEKISNPVQQMNERIATLKSSFMVPGEQQSTLPVIDIMNLISSSIENNIDVIFTRLVIEGNDIHISGKTDAFNSVDIMKSKLENTRQIQTVSVTSSKKERRGDKIVFKLKVTLADEGI